MRHSLLLLASLALLLLTVPACSLDRAIHADGGGGTDGAMDAGCTSSDPEICNGIDDDCDGTVDEGFDLQTELANCGRCGNTCTAGDHGSPTCAAGSCGITCDAAFLDCNGMPADGCEASLSDPHTCGTCANDCTATAAPLCMESGGAFACVDTCAAPTELCGASCVDTTSSVTNCGGCGAACPSATSSTVTCVASTCTYACADGFGDCDMDPRNGCETSTLTVTDCGTCGTPCRISGAVGSCATGACELVMCSTGFADCNSGPGCETATDTLSNCGSCGTVCAPANAAATCPGGTCTLGMCNAGFADCDTLPANGCETDVLTTANCGTCGRSCGAGETCTARGCGDPHAIVEVGTGTSFSCARTADGHVYCWGENASGQLGIGSTTDSNVPVLVPGIANAVGLAVGDAHACVVRGGGAVTCWGENGHRQTGFAGSATDQLSPYDVPGITDGRQITAGGEHTCALRRAGAVSCWGRNDQSQLGTSGGDRGTPMDVTSLSGVTQVDAGGKFNCAVRTAGGVVCWGDAVSRQLGDGGTTDRMTPVTVGTIVDALQVSCGLDFACVVRGSGVVECWGANDLGQLGDGIMVAVRGAIMPMIGLPATGAVEASCGTDHTCVRTSAGALWCVGANSAGQLGDASFTNRSTPVSVAPAVLVTAAAGDQHTCAASATAVYCWGANVSGELGGGSTGGGGNTPSLVMGLPPP